jgi:hypothetical protein
MEVVPNASAVTLGSFIRANIELGSVVLTDGLVSYPAALGAETTRTRSSTSQHQATRRTRTCQEYTAWPA